MPRASTASVRADKAAGGRAWRRVDVRPARVHVHVNPSCRMSGRMQAVTMTDGIPGFTEGKANRHDRECGGYIGCSGSDYPLPSLQVINRNEKLESGLAPANKRQQR